MGALMDRLGALALGRRFWWLALMAAILIGPSMWPVQWSGNEINYFDLSYRFARPDTFTDHHAVFDNSYGRLVPFLLIGKTVDWLGFEGAKTVLALVLWIASSLGVAAVAQGMGLRVAELALGLLVFLRRQGILGNEWLFETVEAKGFAYVAVLFGLAAGLRGRWALAMVLAALATYMHFLVGGFWALAFLVLYLLKGGRLAGALRHGLLFFVLILPVFIILLRERIGVSVDTSGLDMTLDQIYARYSVLFHVAPLIDGITGFIKDWLPGLCAHLLLLAGLVALRDRFPDRATGRWLIGLNVYVLAALAVYMADNGSFRFAQFYLLRPEGLIYLLSLLLAAQLLFRLADGAVARRLGALAVLASVLLVTPKALTNLERMAKDYPAATRMLSALTPDQRGVLDWLRENTAPGDAILVEPVGRGTIMEGDPFPGGLERLSGRGFIVNFKYIPTAKADLVRWYGLIRARLDFFRGDCAANATLGADYAVFRLKDGWGQAGDCVTEVHRNDGYMIGRVLPNASGSEDRG